MMLSDILNSKTLVDMNSVAPTQSSALPPMTSVYNAPSTDYNRKHALQADIGSSETGSPSKKMRVSNTPFHRIPCKARGMSNDHNPETAFIDIPIDAPHGLLLCCSNNECAGSGRRFRYCKICAHPVAKRNFPKRHGHGLISSASDLKEIDYTCGLVNTSDESSMRCQPCETTGPQSPSSQLQKPHHRRTVSDSSKNQLLTSIGCSSVDLSQKTKLNLSINEQAWLSLLGERPNLEDSDNMSRWMERVIAFSSNSSFSVEKTGSQQSNEAFATDVASSRESSIVTPPLAEPIGDVGFLPLTMSSSGGGSNVTDDLDAFAHTQDRRASVDSTLFGNIDMSSFFDDDDEE